MAGELEPVDVMQFMSLRQAATLDEVASLRDFIRDDVRGSGRDMSPDIAALRDESDFGSLVVQEVFCTNDVTDKKLVQKVVNKMRKVTVKCGDSGAVPTGLRALDELAYAHRFDDGSFRILPDRLVTALDAANADLLTRLRLLLQAATLQPAPAVEFPAEPDETFEVDELVKSIEQLLQGRLHTFVFDGGELSGTFRQRKRVLFDALYKLYVLRRKIAVDLQEIIYGLATLHALEWLAIDRFLDSAAGRLDTLDADEKALLGWLETWLPELRPFGLVANEPPALVNRRAALLRLLEATPVVHPIFAQLHRFRRPFNPIRPIGIGDLKVVKQWLVEYLPGEISHVANVLKGETNERATRTLEKTEDVFSFTGQTSQETSTDTQTTDHLELKREVESTVKTDLALKVDASVSASYSAGWAVTIGASAGFAFSRSTEDSSKVAQQFAQDVVSKAVSKLQTQSSQTRSRTTTFESEEAVKHTIENKQQNASHINGFYRFIDKSYMAQLYNFGKRLMFEFIVPEPAGFLVESRLRAFEGGTEVPTKPRPPTLKTVDLGFEPSEINKQKWQELRTTYDLSTLPPYPADEQMEHVVDSTTRETLLGRTDLKRADTDQQWWADSWVTTVEGVGVEVRSVRVVAAFLFWKWDSRPAGPSGDYKYTFMINGYRVGAGVNEVNRASNENWAFVDATLSVPVQARPIVGEQVVFALEALNLASFTMSVRLVLQPSAESLLEWQTLVYNAVRAKERELIDAENREALIQYQTSLGDYYRALKDLEGTAVNDLLQGASSAENHRTIDLELRRHCLAELTMEFDEDRGNDAISPLETIGKWDVDVFFQRMKVEETEPGDGGEVVTTFGWEPERHEAHYPATKLPQARRKGTMVQFLEQAFDWDNLSYLFYPYFWATPPKWIDLMSRADDADPVYTAFLQAGAARVLVSVTPGYEQAAMHYLATGQAWDGGVTPAIGDPLFVAVYQELRNQQDNLADATPEGEPWPFVLPTSLTYLDGGDPLPTFPQA